MMHINAKAIPTNDTDYSCYIKAVELVNQYMGSISQHWFLIALRAGTYTHTHTYTHIHTHTHTRKHTIDTIDYITEI